MITVDFLLECLVAVLLAVTVFYCVVLERKLRALRSGQDGLKDVINALDQATRRAELSLGHLKSDGMRAGASLEGEIEKAGQLLDELKLMVQAGDRVADRLAAAAPSTLRAGTGTRALTDDTSADGESTGDDALLRALGRAR